MAREHHRRPGPKDSADRLALGRGLGTHAQSILEWALDAVITIDGEGSILGWNPQAERVFGWKREEALGRRLVELIIPAALRDAHLAGIARYMKTGERRISGGRFVSRAMRRNGEEFPVEITAVPEKTRRGWLFTAFLHDVSERARFEADLRESEEKFRLAFVQAGAGMAILGLNGRFAQVNHAYASMLGYTEEELLARTFDEVTHPDDRESSRTHARSILTGQVDAVRFDKRYLHRDGRVIWVQVYSSVLRDAAGRPLYAVAQFLDITARREAEEALRQSEEKFRSAFACAQTGLGVATPDGRLIQVNAAFCHMLGYEESELLGRTALEFVHPEEKEEVVRNVSRMLDGARENPDVLRRFVAKDGRTVWTQVSAALVRDAAGQPRYIVAQAQDITRRKLTEDALRASEKTYRLLFEANPDPMWVYDPATLQFLAVNDAAVAQYGFSRSEFRGMSVFDVRPPEEVPALQKAIQQMGKSLTHHGEWRHRKKDGTVFPVEVSTHGIRFEGRDAVLAMLRDLTERKSAEEALRRTEAQLQQAARMEAIGRLAGGIAHDFNNLLTIIQGFAQVLAKKMAKGEPAGSELEEIRHATARGSSLTSQLLAFSRRQVLRPKVLDVNAAVVKTDQFLKRLIGENVDLVTALDPGIGRVEIDPGQLDQVLMNLVLNARDAMPSGGKLTIRTRPDADGEIPGGPWVVLEVSDTGTGMDPAIIEHIFEPFFTTKAPGHGTGLGLATVYGIVQQSGGLISVDSGSGRGTTFRVCLPRSNEVPTSSHPVAAPPRRGTETLLLVEDEPRVRALALRILRDGGYSVLEAPGGPEALQLLETDPRRIDLLITDIVMPTMSGLDLAARVVEKRPGARVLYISGYADAPFVHPGGLPADAHFLSKPFTDETLCGRIREILDAGPAAPEGRGR